MVNRKLPFVTLCRCCRSRQFLATARNGSPGKNTSKYKNTRSGQTRGTRTARGGRRHFGCLDERHGALGIGVRRAKRTTSHPQGLLCLLGQQPLLHHHPASPARSRPVSSESRRRLSGYLRPAGSNWAGMLDSNVVLYVGVGNWAVGRRTLNADGSSAHFPTAWGSWPGSLPASK